MAEAACSVRSPEILQTSGGNQAHSWDKWKNRFDIYLQATGYSEKPAAQKVGLLLNHIGDHGIDIYTNFEFLPQRENPNTDGNLPAENKLDYDTVLIKFDAYFTKRDPQLMLRERFWLHLKREPGHLTRG